ncbi:AAA family ATPase [Oscillatoria sp. HE19RPO]|uniref:AAA family ATPase n=1 Tax=Oscillatoria sp. HE19RPO TaxID=2954806 RepID=UPI0020C39C50|nr:AAA family ATPase [Oscillatoria sp. HE19RPO]
MINSFELKNFGPIQQFACPRASHINVMIGGNGTGKTIFLKALYTAMRTIEDYKRGNEPRSASEILSEKLYWTFEVDKIGDLVRRGSDAPLSFQLSFNGNSFFYEFGKDTTRTINHIENQVSPRESNSIFLPAKEILSLQSLILQSREQSKTFGFDDTYLDLARALRQAKTRGGDYAEFAQSRKSLKDIMSGTLEYDNLSESWQFKKGNQKFSIGVTSEGIKKFSIIDTLLENRYLDPNSIVFIDGIEGALHPTAISKFLDIVVMLAEKGIQFFMASHSYFVIKKLFLIAQEKDDISISIFSASEDNWNTANVKEGLPDNPIIDESIRLYQEEVRLALE